jgi:hypothetical protein
MGQVQPVSGTELAITNELVDTAVVVISVGAGPVNTL